MSETEDQIDDMPPTGQPQYKSRSELEVLPDAELAEYIATSTFDFDGTSQSVRVALARILRRIS